jgi:hypothetical protein
MHAHGTPQDWHSFALKQEATFTLSEEHKAKHFALDGEKKTCNVAGIERPTHDPK